MYYYIVCECVCARETINVKVREIKNVVDYFIINVCAFICVTLGGDKVSMLAHTIPTRTPEEN